MEKQEGYLEQRPVGFVEPATPEAPPRRLIVPAVMDYLEKQSSRWPAHSNRASEIGHPCERYLVYRRVRGRIRYYPTPDCRRYSAWATCSRATFLNY